MPADNTRHLLAASRRRAEDTRRRALAALRRMDTAGDPITFEALAREAGISRSWLYAQNDLRGEITARAPQPRSLPIGNAPPTPRCCTACKPPPTASSDSRTTTASSATPWPQRSGTAAPPPSSANDPATTRPRSPPPENDRTR